MPSEFTGVKMNQEFLNDLAVKCLPGSLAKFHQSGRMQMYVFFHCLKNI